MRLASEPEMWAFVSEQIGGDIGDQASEYRLPEESVLFVLLWEVKLRLVRDCLGFL